MATDAEVRAQQRGDLIKRLFAVAISVGAASTLSRMEWVTVGRMPNLAEWQQLSILVVALTATVLSWDGYLMSIYRRPLIGYWRFAIDIILVFIYMFLLMTSHHKNWWLPIHGVTFILYAIWDNLSVRQYITQYYPSTPVDKTSILQVYINGALNITEAKGPIITLAWCGYFLILTAINLPVLTDKVFISSIFAFSGLVFYRRDKTDRYSMWVRLLVAAGLLVVDAILVRLCDGLGDQRLGVLLASHIG